MRGVARLAAGIVAGLLAADAVAAVSVTNRDDKSHKLTIIEGDSKKDHTLKPQELLDNICAKGCIIRLNDSENDEYELEGTEVVSIEEGYLYYDGPDAPAEPAPGAGGKPEAPKQQ
jgi:hypothetical protein